MKYIKFAATCGNITYVGFTGGEPLLHIEEAVFCSYVRELKLVAFEEIA